MGSSLSSLRAWLQSWQTQEARAVMVGLDNAGKTTILHLLNVGRRVETVPTIGFNVETIFVRNYVITMFDIGGQSKLRPLWSHYYRGCDVLIYVVDSADRDRMPMAAREMHAALLTPELQGCALLVFANKQDEEGCMTPEEVTEALTLRALPGTWALQPCSAHTGDGLLQGVEWLVGALVAARARSA